MDISELGENSYVCNYVVTVFSYRSDEEFSLMLNKLNISWFEMFHAV